VRVSRFQEIELPVQKIVKLFPGNRNLISQQKEFTSELISSTTAVTPKIHENIIF
jgi:hypothetical protein